MNNKGVLIIIGLFIAGLAFWGGIEYNQSKAPVGSQTAFVGRNFAGRGAGAGGMGGFVGGQILSKDATSVTVSMQGGGSKIIFFSNTTPVEKTVSGSATDLSVGTNIAVTGSANPDGSVTASSIMIRPAGLRNATSTQIQAQ